MHFHVRLIDNPDTPDLRETSREAHWAYFDDHRDHFIARGATITDDGKHVLSSVLWVEFDSFQHVETFIQNEPHNQNKVYKRVEFDFCKYALNIKQSHFPRRDGQLVWYIRGYGKPGVNEIRDQLAPAHTSYFRPYDAEHFVVRGGVRSQDDGPWIGSANLIALPSREDVDAFLRAEPFYSSGLYSHVLVERYKFGGRPGQIV